MFGEGRYVNLDDKGKIISSRDERGSEMLSEQQQSYDLRASPANTTFCPCGLKPLLHLFDPQSLLLQNENNNTSQDYRDTQKRI